MALPTSSAPSTAIVAASCLTSARLIPGQSVASTSPPSYVHTMRCTALHPSPPASPPHRSVAIQPRQGISTPPQPPQPRHGPHASESRLRAGVTKKTQTRNHPLLGCLSAANYIMYTPKTTINICRVGCPEADVVSNATTTTKICSKKAPKVYAHGVADNHSPTLRAHGATSRRQVHGSVQR